MKEIPIYKAEAEISGLVEQIKATSSIAYTTQLQSNKESCDLDKVMASLSSKYLSSHAGLKDTDLYPTKSILVSSNWNLNDDVFDKAETWAARNTPAHKPTNLGHDEHKLVGHMTDQWVIDTEGNLIADNSIMDDVPDLFHIVNGAVIYTTWQDAELIERTEKLISEIEAGTKFVSMECLFSNFGYAVISPEGKYYRLARNEATAFLTKHLRAYGGEGVYEGYKLGRLPKNIVFSAKGYVDFPGNTHSVILTAEKLFSFASASEENPFFTETGVSITMKDTHPNITKAEETDMSDSIYKAQSEKAETRVEQLEAKLAEMTEQFNKAGIDKLNAQVIDLTAQVAELTTSRDELAAAKVVVETAKAKADAKVVEVTEAHDVLQTKVEDAEAAVKAAGRVAQLVEAGATTEEATATVGKFNSVDDDQWGEIAEALVAKFNFGKDDDDKDKKDDKKKKDAKADSDEDADDDLDKDSADADEKTLEDAKADEEVVLTTTASAEGDDELAQTRKDLQRSIANRLGRGTDEDNQDSE